MENFESRESSLAIIAKRYGIARENAARLYDTVALAEEANGENFTDILFDRASKTPYYYLTREIAAGENSNVYEASTDLSLNATVVVKQVYTDDESNGTPSLVDNDTESDKDKENILIEREYIIGEVIRRRLGEAFCRDRAVCARSRFYERDGSSGYLTFDLVKHSMDLDDYLSIFLHARMNRWHQAYVRSQFRDSSLFAMRRAAVGGDEYAAELVGEFFRIQTEALSLFAQLVYIVGSLHQQFIFHRDLKPDNVLVVLSDGVRPSSLRLIDFGLSCVESIDYDSGFDRDEKQKMKCNSQYFPIPTFQDPIAVNARPRRSVDKIEQFGKFETYAVAKIGLVIFDPALSDVDKYPVVRELEFMPSGVLSLIERMTGEHGYNPGVGTDNYDGLELSDQEYSARYDLFRERPTLLEVQTQLDEVVKEWYEENKVVV